MLYKSTRSNGEQITSTQAVLQGLSKDGGLYMPVKFEKAFSMEDTLKKDFYGMAEDVFGYFLDDFKDIPSMVKRAYDGKFTSKDITPLVKVGENYVLELFHGPTSAFKDVALSALPVFMTEAMKQEGSEDEIMILTATSGDTGKAAMEGFRDVPGIRIIVFYPYGGVSPVQEKQMTSQEGCNVRSCAIRGNFDDAQTAVKEIFSRVKKEGLYEGAHTVLSSANSINIGRLVPQIVYYLKAYKELMAAGEITFGEPIDFCVPTGNFGDILAGYLAKRLGLPVGKLICASNDNNVLTDFLTTGTYDKNRPFFKTTSPSMDILVSSNLERLLYLELGEDSEKLSALMKDLKEQGIYSIPADVLEKIQKDFSAGFTTEDQVAETIGRVWKDEKYLLDPHTAVAWDVAEKQKSDRKMVVLSTASPYKFPQTVLNAIGYEAPEDAFAVMDELNAKTGVSIPKNLAELKDKQVRFKDVVDRDALYDYVIEQIKKKA